MKTAVKKIKTVKRQIKNLDEKNLLIDEENLPKDLIEAIEDIRLNRNLHGNFYTAEDAVKSMLRD